MNLIEVMCLGCSKKCGLTETAVDLNRYTATKYLYCEDCGPGPFIEPYIRVVELKRSLEAPMLQNIPQQTKLVF